jgi:hypothetical protein
MSSVRKNTFYQKLDISDKNFPSLPSNNGNTPLAGWPIEVGRRFSETAKVYKNGDVFDGIYDDKGLPVYGKIVFANGNVYEGCVHSIWHKEEDYNTDDDNDEIEENFDEYYEEHHTDWFMYSNYGVMTNTDGKKFYGSFCFPDKHKW